MFALVAMPSNLVLSAADILPGKLVVAALMDITGEVPPELAMGAVPVTPVTVPVFEVYPLGLVAGYAPRLVNAAAAVVAPVPPLAIGNVPVTLAVRLTVERYPLGLVALYGV